MASICCFVCLIDWLNYLSNVYSTCFYSTLFYSNFYINIYSNLYSNFYSKLYSNSLFFFLQGIIFPTDLFALLFLSGFNGRQSVCALVCVCACVLCACVCSFNWAAEGEGGVQSADGKLLYANIAGIFFMSQSFSALAFFLFLFCSPFSPFAICHCCCLSVDCKHLHNLRLFCSVALDKGIPSCNSPPSPIHLVEIFALYVSHWRRMKMKIPKLGRSRN